MNATFGRQRRGGLGRGLGALIPTAPPGDDDSTNGASETPLGTIPIPMSADGTHGAVDDTALVPVAGAEFAELSLDKIRTNPRQPRQVFDEDSHAELTHSVREFGVLQPVVVRRADDAYELVMGERRLRAAADAGLATIPAIVRDTADDAMLRDALLENVHRVQLNPLEEAAAYQQLLDEFGATHDELAQRIGRSRPQVTNTIRLLNLPVPVQRRVAAGVISAGHARALLGTEDPDVQDELATRIVAEGLSVRAIEELVALHRAGHTEKRPTRRGTVNPRLTAPAVTELADKLSDAFDTKVRVDIGRRKGRITVEFASVDDLERIVAVMAPQLATHHGAGALPSAEDTSRYDDEPDSPIAVVANHSAGAASPTAVNGTPYGDGGQSDDAQRDDARGDDAQRGDGQSNGAPSDGGQSDGAQSDGEAAAPLATVAAHYNDEAPSPAGLSPAGPAGDQPNEP